MHGRFIETLTPIRFQLLNEFLYGFDVTQETLPGTVNMDMWSVGVPDATFTFTFRYLTNGLQIKRDDFAPTSWENGKLSFPVKKESSLSEGTHWRLVLQTSGSAISRLILHGEGENECQEIMIPAGETSVEFVAKHDWTFIELQAHDYSWDFECLIQSIALESLDNK